MARDPYTLENLALDIIPRLGNAPTIPGMSIVSAANILLHSINDRLLERASDLHIQGDLDIDVDAGDVVADLPDDFVSMMEKPRATSATDSTIVDVMQPEYLDSDEDHDNNWWEWYGFYGYMEEPPALRPRYYKIVGRVLYLRPAATEDITITGRYNALPTDFTDDDLTTGVPWGGLFDQVFREGVIRILTRGATAPNFDTDFRNFIHQSVDSKIDSRIRLIRDVKRIKRNNWL